MLSLEQKNKHGDKHGAFVMCLREDVCICVAGKVWPFLIFPSRLSCFIVQCQSEGPSSKSLLCQQFTHGLLVFCFVLPFPDISQNIALYLSLNIVLNTDCSFSQKDVLLPVFLPCASVLCTVSTSVVDGVWDAAQQ